MNCSPWHIAVLVPARNEEELLPHCLSSVLAAGSVLPANVTFDVVVAVDRSTDQTFTLARAILAEYGTVIRTDAGVVGRARSLAAETALNRYHGPRQLCWLANTDADCTIPKSWLLSQISLAESGVEAVTGIVDVDSFVEHRPGVEGLFRAGYTVFQDGSHPHVHGANFGVRADAYLRAGGWSHLATAEDHDLWKRLSTIGTNRQSNSSIKVVTSGRRMGRAPHGFADALAAHDEALL
jgi:glycosyltransferase involved in cell wall biosynthesis